MNDRAALRMALASLEAATAEIKKHLNGLSGLDLQHWPMALSSSEIVYDDRLAAQQIVKWAGPYMTGEVLCYGVGKAVADAALYTDAVSKVVLHGADGECTDDRVIPTKSSEAAVCNAPYDFILLYDSLDHDPDPSATLKSLGSMLKPNGVIGVRLHPWTARDGGHCHEAGLNYAWIHLAVELSELEERGARLPHQRHCRPLAFYDAMVKKSGLTTLSRELVAEAPEAFFDGHVLELMIEKTWGGSVDAQTARSIMAHRHVDYFLSND